MQNDEELERYLSNFQPRAVRPLVAPRPARRPARKAMAAAAILLVCAGGVLWYSRKVAREPVAPSAAILQPELADSSRPNLFALTRMALEDDQKFQSELENESRAELLRFDGPESGLRILTRE